MPSLDPTAALAGLAQGWPDPGVLYERWERVPLRLGLELHLRADAQAEVVAFARQIEALARR